MQVLGTHPRVLLVDDHPEMLRQTSSLLAGAYDVVGTLDSGSGLPEALARLKPDFLVLDISLPGASGLALAESLRAAGCAAPIIFLTIHADEDYVQAALASGAAGYVLKARLATDLPLALAAAEKGDLFVSDGAGMTHTGAPSPRHPQP